jgi:hypothetical protein
MHHDCVATIIALHLLDPNDYHLTFLKFISSPHILNNAHTKWHTRACVACAMTTSRRVGHTWINRQEGLTMPVSYVLVYYSNLDPLLVNIYNAFKYKLSYCQARNARHKKNTCMKRTTQATELNQTPFRTSPVYTLSDHKI